MQIVKQGGSRSVVEKNSTNNQERKIARNSKARKTTKESNSTIDVKVHLLTDQRFFIAQWASMLDKMLAKPIGNQDKPSKATREAREAASQAFIKFWDDNKEKEGIKGNLGGDLKEKWKLKVHPYSTSNYIKDTPVKTYRWYNVFAGDQNVTECDWDKVAEKIYHHLYIEQYEKNQEVNRPTHKTGLISRKAEAIQKNARNYTLTDNGNLTTFFSNNEKLHIKALSEPEPEWEQLKTDYQLSLLTDDLKKTEKTMIESWVKKDKKGGEPSLLRKDAMKCLYDHYARVFLDEKNKPLGYKDAKKQPLWRYHTIIKEALMQRYPKHYGAPKKQRPEINENILHKLALNIEKNRQMAFAIRLGKVIHYEGGLQAANPDNINSIIASKYWTSLGQTIIKQNESFVRQWMGAIAIASSTLKNLLDPDNKVDQDVLTGSNKQGDESGFYQILNQLETEIFDNQFELLFGSNHNLYDKNEENQRLEIIKDLRETLAQLRHATFHFKDITEFNKQLNALKEKNTHTNIIESYINRHQTKRQDLILNDLRSANIKDYLTQTEFNKIRRIALSNKRALMTLPKFNKLLDRDNKTTKQLIPPAKKARMDIAAYKASYHSMKILYESDFGHWINENGQDVDIPAWIKKAKERVENTNNRKKFIESKVSRLRNINPDETLTHYLSYLTQQTAQEFQVQENTYKPNQKGAREQSNFVENYKQDILIQGFKAYLSAQKLDKLSKGESFSKIDRPAEIRPVIKSEIPALERPWLYMLLHLMPIEALNHISLQIRKHHVLTQDTGYEKIDEAVSLFLDMGKSALDLKELRGYKEISKFYESEDLFSEKFEQSDTKTQESLIPVAGLREILRYGNIQQLQQLFADNLISYNRFLNFETYNEQVADAQKMKLSLREGFEKGVKPSDQQKKDYKEQQAIITQHRILKNHIYLHNHKQAHQLIMQILGRLAGFSQLWERDLYFVLLALFLLKKVKPEDYVMERKNENASIFEEDINNGQIVLGFRKMKKCNASVIAVKDSLKVMFKIKDNTGCQTTKIRNNLAHFNTLQKNELIDITKLINETRQLMAYDRKIKNSVSRSMIELLERNNFIIQFKINSHKLELKELKAKTVDHLGDKNIKEELHGEKYVATIKKLFLKV